MPATPDSMDVLKQFRLIYKSVKTHFQDIENQCHVSGSQLWALSVIARQPGIRVSELAKEMAIHQSTASNLIERLVTQGFVLKERSTKDQRIVQLHPTAKGRLIVVDAPKPTEGVLPNALAHLSPITLSQLHGNLEEVIGLLKLREKSGANTPLADM